jgi:hypothetical protein
MIKQGQWLLDFFWQVDACHVTVFRNSFDDVDILNLVSRNLIS